MSAAIPTIFLFLLFVSMGLSFAMMARGFQVAQHSLTSSALWFLAGITLGCTCWILAAAAMVPVAQFMGT